MHFGFFRWGLNPLRREPMLNEMNRQVLTRLRLEPAREDLLVDLGCGVGATVRYAAGMYPRKRIVGVTIPGSRDVLVFVRKPRVAGKSGGVAHFGFRHQKPQDIGKAAPDVERAGGRIRSRGEFVPGEPYLFVEDPDGYEVEIWFEIPTPVDPKTKRLDRFRNRT